MKKINQLIAYIIRPNCEEIKGANIKKLLSCASFPTAPPHVILNEAKDDMGDAL